MAGEEETRRLALQVVHQVLEPAVADVVLRDGFGIDHVCWKVGWPRTPAASRRSCTRQLDQSSRRQRRQLRDRARRRRRWSGSRGPPGARFGNSDEEKMRAQDLEPLDLRDQHAKAVAADAPRPRAGTPAPRWPRADSGSPPSGELIGAAAFELAARPACRPVPAQSTAPCSALVRRPRRRPPRVQPSGVCARRVTGAVEPHRVAEALRAAYRAAPAGRRRRRTSGAAPWRPRRGACARGRRGSGL